MKKLESISAKETLELIKKPWASNNDICKLACCGKEKASKIKNDIEDKLEKNNYSLPRGKVPMDILVEYLKININYLKKISK